MHHFTQTASPDQRVESPLGKHKGLGAVCSAGPSPTWPGGANRTTVQILSICPKSAISNTASDGDPNGASQRSEYGFK